MIRTPQETFRQLQALAREGDRNTQALLELFVHERFLARLSQSPYKGRFVLKGGMLLATMGVRRATRDIDMLAIQMSNDPEAIQRVAGEVATIDLDDGVTFDAAAIASKQIREDAEYQALRLSLPARVAQARLKLTIDINFGDPALPKKIDYPTLLDDDPFGLLGYRLQTVIAEKGETMIARGDANTRLRDFGDVMRLGRVHQVTQADLRGELVKVATHRQRSLRPLAEVLDTLPTARQADWVAFRRQAELEMSLPESFQEVVDYVIGFLDLAITAGGSAIWNPAAGRWEK